MSLQPASPVRADSPLTEAAMNERDSIIEQGTADLCTGVEEVTGFGEG